MTVSAYPKNSKLAGASLIRVVGVVNSKYFISAWNEVIEANGHNFWTVCPMAVKNPKSREFYCLLFALNLNFADAKICIYGYFTGAAETYVFSKVLKTNMHRNMYRL